MKVLTPLDQNTLNQHLSQLVIEDITQRLNSSLPGHCLRVSTLSENIMQNLCAYLNQNGQDADVVMLIGQKQTSSEPWQVSASRLVELRNTGKRPLLVFIPPGLKTAAEDSFDVSTFVEVDLGNVPDNLQKILREQLPTQLQEYTDRVTNYLGRVERIITSDDIVRYYLTILENELTNEAAGGAIFQLHLVPDFRLFQNPDRIEQRLERNLASLQILVESSQPLLGCIHGLKLKQGTIQTDLYNFLRSETIDDVRAWGETIATHPSYYSLSFDQWPFEGEKMDRDKVLLYLDDVGLSRQKNDEEAGPDNPLYLEVNKAKSIRLKWETNPKPAAVPDLAYFRIEIVSTDGAITWESKNIINTQARAAYRSRNLKVSEFRDHVEDGLYFFRIRAYTENGDILSEEDAEKHPEVLQNRINPDGKRIYESEDVWFWVDDSEPAPAEPQRNITVNSYLEAHLYAQFAAVERGDNPFDPNLHPRDDKTGWSASKNKRAEGAYQIVYDAQARYSLPVSNLLRQIETDTLKHPGNLGRWRLDFSQGVTHDSADPRLRQIQPNIEIPPSFVEARTNLFETILGEGEKITSAVNLLEYREQILNYATAYQEWLKMAQNSYDQASIREENGRQRTQAVYLDIDLVEVILPGDTAALDRVYLLAPTHPMRLLWHLQRYAVTQEWIHLALNTGDAISFLTPAIRQFMRTGIIPVNIPPMIKPSHTDLSSGISRYYVEQSSLNLFWGLYVREDTPDSRTLRTRAQKALGISRQITALDQGGISKKVLTQKLLRYLVQHPYIRVLRINAFNPGDAGLLVDAILGVEKDRNKKRLPALRYELRLFTQGSDPENVGDAVLELMDPENQVSPEADAFAVPSQNHLFPKMRFSRNSTQEFLKEPEAYESHITLLHDLFPVDVAVDKKKSGRSSFAYGLIQEQVTHFDGDARHYAWQRQLLANPCYELDADVNSLSQLLADLLEQTTSLQASVAIGNQVENVIPSLQLTLDLDHKNLLYQVHVVSDWVFIIDRHLGLEYFDSDLSIDRMAYLLDFTPEFGGTDTDRLMLTTRSIDEVSHLIKPKLDEYGLYTRDDVAEYFLQLMRSLSGRLALKLLSSPSQVQEVLGLSLARLFLEQYGLLEDKILVPLDAHSGLFSGLDSQVNLEDEVSLKRGDLLLVSCNEETRNLHFHFVEVKWRKDLGELSAYVSLRQEIENQIHSSENAMRLHFDPDLKPVDRLDRQIKIKEIISLLNFYLARSRRYGLISADGEKDIQKFVESLDQGYSLTCSGTGLIFDFGFQGLEQDIEHAGLIFHHIGADYIHHLLQNGLRRRDLLLDEMKEDATTIEEAEQKQISRGRIITDTSMRRDKTYQRVQELFQPPLSISPIREEEKLLPSEQKGQLAPDASESVTHDEVQVVSDQAERTEPTNQEHESQSELGDDTPVESVQEPDNEVEGFKVADELPYDVLLGDSAPSQQFGIFGKAAAKTVALDLNGTNTISLFGVQGGGKSYTLGTILEMATQQFEGINKLPAPLASVVFHYHESQDYPPEFVSMIHPNQDEAQVRSLDLEFGGKPGALDDVIILTSADKLSERKKEFPNIQVEPIYFSSNELSFKDWRFLMGVVGNQMYMKQINMIMRQLREKLTLATLKSEIEDSPLSEAQKQIADIRINFAAQFINDNIRLADILTPGRLIIVDLRDEFIDKDEALGLFVVMLNIFANAGHDKGFNKLIVFDEAHKYMDNPDLTGHIVDVIRQMRHQGVSVLIASQDPPSLPNSIIELSSLVILHRFNSPQWLKHVQRAITALSDLTPAQMASLRPGDAFVWATKATERIFNQKAVKTRLRPRVTQHGGETKRAI